MENCVVIALKEVHRRRKAFLSLSRRRKNCWRMNSLKMILLFCFCQKYPESFWVGFLSLKNLGLDRVNLMNMFGENIL